MFYDCGNNRNEWVKGAYRDVSKSKDAKVIAARKKLERIMKTLPAPDYNDPELAAQWKTQWLKSKRFVKPYTPPYLEK